MNNQKQIEKKRLWIARGFIFIVLFLNLQAAFLFGFYPHRFSPSFELQGLVGATVIKAIAVLFFMWNIPYIFACVNPVRFKTSLLEAIFMQASGVIGESIILLQLPASLPVLQQSIQRFILFDTSGLVALLLAFRIINTGQIRIEKH